MEATYGFISDQSTDLSARLPFQLKLFPARLDSTAEKPTTATMRRRQPRGVERYIVH